ncbi:MAG: zinc finger domain-containing protein, partial [Chloroflexota bacterium]
RKFGRIYLVKDPQQVLGKLGPEPLSDDFTLEVFHERIKNKSRVIKPLLLDQTFVAGVGNIYADESLFYAKIRPDRKADTLEKDEIEALYHAIRKALQLGIDREGASISNYVKPDGTKGDMQNAVNVFRRTGAPCYTCTGEIIRIVLGQRSTHYCPDCQV